MRDRILAVPTALASFAMLLITGGVVAFIAVSVIMPMYTIMGSVR